MHLLRQDANTFDEWAQLLTMTSRFPKLRCISSKVFSSEELMFLAEFCRTLPKLNHLRAFIAYNSNPLELSTGFENLTSLSLIEIEGCSDIRKLLYSFCCPNLKKLFLVHQRPENIDVKEVVERFPTLDHISLACFVGSFEHSIIIDFKTSFISKMFAQIREGQMISVDFKPLLTPIKIPLSRQDLAIRYHAIQTLLKNSERIADMLELVPSIRKATVSMYTVPPELPFFFSWLAEIDDLEFAILSGSDLFKQTITFKATKLRLFVSDFPPLTGSCWIQKNFSNLEMLEFPDLHNIIWLESPPNFKHIICLNSTLEEELECFLDRSKSCNHVSLPRYNFQDHKAKGTFDKFPGVNFDFIKGGFIVFEYPYIK
ncbi:hypothetical protein DSO57_1022944 [Entomophthora muscae]|uniref:Uncharacterized protein n=1 Tax=Entomophthora muscae TaxID=34485 RepID=A0ACC2RHT6_9FUNG|nr:hypothetical protein DSO57_1022944 [Entomophthora muscae]